MPQQPVFDVLVLVRLAQQRVGLQVDHPHRQDVGGAPSGIQPLQLHGVKRSLVPVSWVWPVMLAEVIVMGAGGEGRRAGSGSTRHRMHCAEPGRSAAARGPSLLTDRLIKHRRGRKAARPWMGLPLPPRSRRTLQSVSSVFSQLSRIPIKVQRTLLLPAGERPPPNDLACPSVVAPDGLP